MHGEDKTKEGRGYSEQLTINCKCAEPLSLPEQRKISPEASTHVNNFLYTTVEICGYGLVHETLTFTFIYK